MRFIDTTSVPVAKQWLKKAKAFNPRWSYFKLELEKLVGKKCWYSESSAAGSNNPIDHFRPKSAKIRRFTTAYANLDKNVWQQIDEKSRRGYPHLKHEFLNYRYACDYVNSAHINLTDGVTKGKWDFFPLQKGSKYGKTREDFKTNIEVVSLLDPCNPQDVELLKFTKNGLIEASIIVLTGSWEFCRVKVSIELYHLMYPYFVERRLEVWDDCERTIELATKLHKKKNKNQLDNEILANYIAEIHKRIKKRSEHSAVSIDCLKYYIAQNNTNWLSYYFPNNLLVK